MDSWLRSKLCWGIFLVGGAAFVFYCCGHDRNPPGLPPVEDAFVSYLQAADGLANLLLNATPVTPTTPGTPNKKSRQEQIVSACEELEKLQAAAAALPPGEIKRMTLAEKDLVARAKRAWDELSRRHAKSPNIPDADWPRLEAAFRLCGELNQPK